MYSDLGMGIGFSSLSLEDGEKEGSSEVHKTEEAVVHHTLLVMINTQISPNILIIYMNFI